MNTGTWTEEQMTMLLSMIGAATASKIGRAIGKTRNAVLGKIHRLGLHSDAQKSRKHYKTWTADKEAMLRQLHAASVTYASIAVTIGDGMTEKAVSAKCTRLLLDYRPLY